MTSCQHCTRKTLLPLCTPCSHHLADLIDELPWLLHQLDVTMTRQDHLDAPTAGHTNPNPNAINVGAMELLRDVAHKLHVIADDIAPSNHVPALVNASPAQIAVWLKNNIPALQASPDAGSHYRTIEDLVGDRQPGLIHHAINRPDLRVAGPCPTIRGRDRDGETVPCKTMLYAHDGELFVRCPRCDCQIDVEENRRRAAQALDLLPADLILEVLDYLDEPVQSRTLYGWITAGKLKSQGFLTRRGWAKRRTRPSDPRVYSLTAARALAAK